MSSSASILGSSYPVKTIAVAISFSPYCQSVLLEAKHLADVLGASLLLIHVGKKNTDKELRVLQMIQDLKINPESSTVIWTEGKEVKAILDECDKYPVDLLVLGAKVKENMITFYIGSVARKISRKAKCSVLLVTKPGEAPQKYSKMVINGVDDIKTENTIDTALYFAEHLKTKEAFIVQEMDLSLSLNAQVHSLKEKKELQTNNAFIQFAIKKHESKNLRIKNNIVKGKTGYAISKFAQSKKADLLVINAPDIQLNVMDRIFTHDMEYILAHLPCNLLIVHPRVKTK